MKVLRVDRFDYAKLHYKIAKIDPSYAAKAWDIIDKLPAHRTV